MKPCKSGSQTVAARVHINFKLGSLFGKHAYPAVKALQIKHSKLAALQIFLHNKGIGDGVCNRGACCKDHSTAIVLLLDQMHFIHHIATFF